VSPVAAPAAVQRVARPPVSIRWPRRWTLVLPLIATAIAYLVLAYGYGKPFGEAGEPSFLMRAGSEFASPDLLPRGTYVNPGTGYDGQFFFYIAQDPLLQSDETERHLDSPAYRYRRILLPVLGWLTSGGNPEVLQWTLPLIGLLAILGSGLLLARALARRGASPWLSVIYMLSIGPVVGTLNDLSDPLAAGLFVAGLIWWSENRALPALLAFTAAPFARELFIVPVAAICLIELARWRWRGWPWLLPIASFGAWALYVAAIFSGRPARGTEVAEPSIVPIAGAISKVGSVLRGDVTGAANWEILFIAFVLTSWLFLAWRSGQGLAAVARRRAWPSRSDLLPAASLLALLFVPFLTAELWSNPLSYARYATPLGALLLLIYASRRDAWALRLAVALFALSIVNPLVGLLPMSNGPVITVV
jgi:hypothetical protein